MKKSPLIIVALCAALASASAAQKPNILLILADDLGYGDVRCYNDQSKVATPHLDRLARDGMRFTDAHSPSTVCTPTRYSLMTGQMAFRVPNGGTVFQGAGGPSLIAPGRLTLPAMLKKQGYATAAVGKWHVGLTFRDEAGEPIHSGKLEEAKRIDFSRRVEGGPVDHGFEKFFGTACCPTTDWIYAFIDGDRVPVPPAGPLDKSQLPKHPYANDCRPGFIAPNFPMEEVDLVFLKKSREFLEQHVRATPDKPFFLYHAAQAVHLPSFPAPQFKGKSGAGPHGDFIHQLDWVVGELMSTLEKLGVADNTLVIFTSDNGGAHYIGLDGLNSPYRGWKATFFEGGIHVPFFMRWPGMIPKRSTVKSPVSHFDIFATAAAAAGRPVPTDRPIDGVNLLPFITQAGAARPHDTLFWRTDTYRVVRDGDWKLQVSERPQKDWLFDLAADPTEKVNLAAKEPERLAAMKAKLATWEKAQRKPMWPSLGEGAIPIDKSLKQKLAPEDEYVYYSN